MAFMFKDLTNDQNRLYPVRKDKLYTEQDATSEIFEYVPRGSNLSSVTTNVGSNSKFATSILLIGDYYFMIYRSPKDLFLISSNSKQQLKTEFFTLNQLSKSTACPFRSYMARKGTRIEDVFEFLWEESKRSYAVDSNNTHTLSWECQRRFAFIKYDINRHLKDNISSHWRPSTIWINMDASCRVIHQADCTGWPDLYDSIAVQSVALYDVEKTKYRMLMLKSKPSDKFYVSMQIIRKHLVILIANRVDRLAPWKEDKVSPFLLDFASSRKQAVVKKNTTFKDFRAILEGALPVKSPRKFLINLATSWIDLKEFQPKGIPLLRPPIQIIRAEEDEEEV